MIEILPHFWIAYYHDNILLKNIKNIIHLSKNEPFFKKNIEEIRVPIDYEENQSLEEKNNIMYQHLYDITDYIHDKVINSLSVLLIGYLDKEDIDTIIIAYFIRFGKLTIRDSIIYLKTKKKLFLKSVIFTMH